MIYMIVNNIVQCHFHTTSCLRHCKRPGYPGRTMSCCKMCTCRHALLASFMPARSSCHYAWQVTSQAWAWSTWGIAQKFASLWPPEIYKMDVKLNWIENLQACKMSWLEPSRSRCVMSHSYHMFRSLTTCHMHIQDCAYMCLCKVHACMLTTTCTPDACQRPQQLLGKVQIMNSWKNHVMTA